MKKVYKLIDLDCANCAAKMSDACSKLDHVEKCSFNFMTQKMTLNCDEQYLDETLTQIQHICKKIEPDMEIVLD